MRTPLRLAVTFFFATFLVSLSVVGDANAVTTSSSGATGSSSSQPQLASQGQDVCSQDVPAQTAHCNSVLGIQPAVLPNQVGVSTPAVSTLGDDGAYSPAFLQSAYNVASWVQAVGNGAGQIVAVVDAYSSPTTVSDLAYYRSFFKLGACPAGTVSSANTSCKIEIVNSAGATAPLPSASSSWALEESIDIDMVSAICPNCQILLVEAPSAAIADLGVGVNTAVALGATVVSNSYGSTEYPSEVNDSNAYFNHPRIPIVAASGDTGYGVEFPAASPDVIAVGGTSLIQHSANGVRDGSSTVWSDTAGGCSAYEPKPAWQDDTGCANRTDNDVAAVGDPSTGVWAYDTYNYGGLIVAGGTSVAAPIIGALYALAAPMDHANYPVQYLYANTNDLTPVTQGSDGTCGTYLCNAPSSQGVYNGPTGDGTPTASPNSASAFSALPNSRTGTGTGPGTGTIAPTTLTAPVLVSATASSGSVTLTWIAPSGSGTAPSGYDVLEGVATQAPAPPPINSNEITSTTYVVSGLTSGTKYNFSVEAQSDEGTSVPSNVLSATPSSSSSGAPSAPRDVVASTSNALAVVSWSTPTSAGSSPITNYVASDQQGASCTDVVGTGPVNTCTINGLTNGQSYVFSVSATNAAGTSPLSSSSTSVNPGRVPAPPIHVTGVSGDQSITVNWQPPLADGGSAITSYTASDGPTHTCHLVVTDTDPDSCTIANLTNGDSYRFSVTSSSAAGTSRPSVRSARVLVATNTPARLVSAGNNFACALLVGGSVKCWGNNTYGQLGNGTLLSSATQVQVRGVSGATQISTGIDSACAVVARGAVKCWGANTFSQLGNGSTGNETTAVTVSGLTGVRQLTSGFHFRCALIVGGTAKCWGYNDNGQLGNGTFLTEKTPVAVTNLRGATSIEVDEDHTCAILANGTAMCWGANSYGQLGDGTTTVSRVPVIVQGLSAASAIGVGFSNTCALLRTGSVECWGYNGDGELGNASTTGSTAPVVVTGISGATSLAVGNFNSCAKLASGMVSCWGLNSASALSANTTTAAAPAAPALSLPGELNLSLDSGYSCALLKNQSVECWVDGAPTVTVLWFPNVANPNASNITTNPSAVARKS